MGNGNTGLLTALPVPTFGSEQFDCWLSDSKALLPTNKLLTFYKKDTGLEGINNQLQSIYNQALASVSTSSSSKLSCSSKYGSKLS